MANMASAGKSGPGQWRFLVVGGLAAVGERSLGAGWRSWSLEADSASIMAFPTSLVIAHLCHSGCVSSGFSILVYVLEASLFSFSEGMHKGTPLQGLCVTSVHPQTQPLSPGLRRHSGIRIGRGFMFSCGLLLFSFLGDLGNS